MASSPHRRDIVATYQAVVATSPHNRRDLVTTPRRHRRHRAVVKTSPRYRRASDRHSRGAVRPPRDFAVTKSRPPHDSVSVSSRRRRGVVTLSLRRSRRRDQYRQVAHDASNAAETQFRDRERRLSVSAAPSFLSRLPSAGAGEPLPTKLLSNGSVAACVAVPACSLAPGETQT